MIKMKSNEKLTMVSIVANGKRLVKFVKGTLGTDGKTRISQRDHIEMLSKTNLNRGDTYTNGG